MENGVEKGVQNGYTGYTVSNERYVQLALFCAAQFLGSMPWNIFAPIYLVAEARWDVGQQRINALSNAWNIYTAPGSLLALWAMERHGLRNSLLVGISTQFLACVLAWRAHINSARPARGAAAARGAAGAHMWRHAVRARICRTVTPSVHAPTGPAPSGSCA